MGMLVLSRREGELIVLRDANNDIVCEIAVFDIRPSSVRVGIDAPADIVIERKEIDEAIQTWGRKEKDE